MSVRIGTSGWQYRDWRDAVYHGTAQRRWLEIYAERFDTVEVNSSFYRLPERSTFERWAASTPSDFTFAVKMSRYLSHIRRLRGPEEPVARFLDRAAGLGDKLSVALLQLPPDLPCDIGRLEGLLKCWPRSVRLAVEFRHESWFVDEVRELLAGHQVATCLADRRERPTGPVWRTADWWYLRLHEGTGRPSPGYHPRTLREWTRRLENSWRSEDDGFAYFNNDANACAPRDADRLTAMLPSQRPASRSPGNATAEHT